MWRTTSRRSPKARHTETIPFAVGQEAPPGLGGTRSGSPTSSPADCPFCGTRTLHATRGSCFKTPKQSCGRPSQDRQRDPCRWPALDASRARRGHHPLRIDARGVGENPSICQRKRSHRSALGQLDGRPVWPASLCHDQASTGICGISVGGHRLDERRSRGCGSRVRRALPQRSGDLAVGSRVPQVTFSGRAHCSGVQRERAACECADRVIGARAITFLVTVLDFRIGGRRKGSPTQAWRFCDEDVLDPSGRSSRHKCGVGPVGDSG